MDRKPYPTDLTDAQWAILEPMLPPHRPKGRKRQVELREVANALLHLLRTGCPWRHLPHDLPSWMTVWWCFRTRRDDGTLDALHGRLRDMAREAVGEKKTPTAGIVDSQTARTTEKGGREATTLARGFKDASATLSSIPSDSFWGWPSSPPPSRTETAPSP